MLPADAHLEIGPGPPAVPHREPPEGARAVGGRPLALPLEAYRRRETWGDANDAWIEVAQQVGEQALAAALDSAGLGVEEAQIECDPGR